MSDPAIPKSINDLRSILSEEIANLRGGTSSPAKVNAVTNAVGKILSSVKLEMEYLKIKGDQKTIAYLTEHAGDATAAGSESHA
jgi:hypothetical protein